MIVLRDRFTDCACPWDESAAERMSAYHILTRVPVRLVQLRICLGAHLVQQQ